VAAAAAAAWQEINHPPSRAHFFVPNAVDFTANFDAAPPSSAALAPPLVFVPKLIFDAPAAGCFVPKLILGLEAPASADDAAEALAVAPPGLAVPQAGHLAASSPHSTKHAEQFHPLVFFAVLSQMDPFFAGFAAGAGAAAGAAAAAAAPPPPGLAVPQAGHLTASSPHSTKHAEQFHPLVFFAVLSQMDPFFAGFAAGAAAAAAGAAAGAAATAEPPGLAVPQAGHLAASSAHSTKHAEQFHVLVFLAPQIEFFFAAGAVGRRQGMSEVER
jgi:hypothetical protein